MPTAFDVLTDYLPARFSTTADLPWIPSATPGKSSKPLRFLADDRGFVELLRMEPGVVMPLHRHTGEIHAYNLAGSRKLCTGEVIGPGDYVYEPPGNTDWWKIVGDETMVALVIVMGTVEFVGPGGSVRARASASTQLAEYERHCREHGLPVHDLVER
ncbi:cupin domain-containing protein [Pseudoxanthomonas sacheonensis]|uniref:Quercetin dioxygenase-like cupin family protein n=1 Tax=Pseudoxanthomonas sacheonensis TaxID=443615 RepID=A0ABU1RNT1_9GAMM|nr:cupin domain-containing protein [Pseudoxanthomonas sacheonensis]MDR6840438.1 quercetin dioxygenase-like cupin family protein [Pseudoxanthomonas sacheonensis]